MTRNVIVTDLNRCVDCKACVVACKMDNGIAPGSFWLKILRIGPNPIAGKSGQYPDVEMYYLPVQCQHCENPECVKVCPTEASHKTADGTVQVDKEKCIGCQFCAMACPYGVRYLNEEERVVEKCTLCEQQTTQGELPLCVQGCTGRARFFGDLEKGIENLEGPPNQEGTRETLAQVCKPFDEGCVHHLPDVGNSPAFRYILRERQWQGHE